MSPWVERGPLVICHADHAAHIASSEAAIRRLKIQLAGEIEVAGPVLAGSLTDAGLIDEYRMYLHPVVLGGGKPFFTGPRPPLHLVASDLVAEDVIRLRYIPA